MAVMNPVSTVQADATSGLPTEQKSTSGSAHVTLSGTSTVIPSSSYPSGATAITAASGNVAAATAAATLAAVAAKTTYITGFSVTGSGATVGLPVSVTIVGTITGTLTYTYIAASGALVANTPLHVMFPVPIPASATNTTIVVSCPTLGAGNTNNTTVAHGYQL